MEELKKQPLFSNFTEEDFDLIIPYLKRCKFDALDYIFEEGDQGSSDLFFIVKGSVKILKWDPSHHFTYTLGHIEEGNAFGEIAFINQTPRTSTIEALKETTVYSLQPDVLKKNERLKNVYQKLLENIAILSNQRVVETSEKYIYSSRQATEKLETTFQTGHTLCEFIGLAFLLNIALYILLSGFHSLSTSLFNFIYWLSLGTILFLFKERLLLFWDQMGFESDNFWKSMNLAARSLIVILPCLYLFSFIYGSKEESSHVLWFIGLVPYVILFELVLRGFFLKKITIFLGSHKNLQAIAMTSIFSVFMPAIHLHPIAPMLLFLSLSLNFLLTWIFTKAPNLSGVIFVHFFALFFAKMWHII